MVSALIHWSMRKREGRKVLEKNSRKGKARRSETVTWRRREPPFVRKFPGFARLSF